MLRKTLALSVTLAVALTAVAGAASADHNPAHKVVDEYDEYLQCPYTPGDPLWLDCAVDNAKALVDDLNPAKPCACDPEPTPI